MSEDQADGTDVLIMHTADIVMSYVANNAVAADDVSTLIRNIYATLGGLGTAIAEEAKPEPAVSIRASVKKDHVVCLEDGKKMKMLKRHLMTDHGLTPEQYRERWNLPADYPMVAPDYAEQRRELAVKIGLGRKPGQKRGRKSAAKATGSTTASAAPAKKRAPRARKAGPVKA